MDAPTTFLLAAAGAAPCPQSVHQWDIEDSSSPWPTSYHINDANNNIGGDFNSYINSGGTNFLVNGATAVNARNYHTGPGYAVSQPSVPAASTPFTNPFSRDAAVIVSGGSSVAISIDGQCFEQTGSAHAVVKKFAAERLKIPGRHAPGGLHAGELYWKPLGHDLVLFALHNPDSRSIRASECRKT